MNRIAPPHEIDPLHFRKVMGRFATGVTVITARVGGEAHGMTANAFMSGSLDPPLCVVSVAKRAHMHAYLLEARRFAVNILAADQTDYANHFAGRLVADLVPRFAEIDAIPTLIASSARIIADLAATHDCGDHTIFIGHILRMEAEDRPPLLYYDGHYAALQPARGAETPLPEFW
ncbi:MAG: flavin reductase [Bauldia sp.]|nr:flavin reductase [Bauldia sp.]